MEKTIYGNNSILYVDNKILIEQLPLDELTNKFTTPFFIFMKNRIISNIQTFQKSLHEIFQNFRFFYSVKANYLVDILKIIDNEGVPFEVVSEFEFDILKKKNLNTDAMVIGGPYLPESLIKKALGDKNPIFIAYSLESCKKLEKVAISNEIDTINVILRLKSPKKNSHLGFKINTDNIHSLNQIFQNFKRIRIIGLLSHFGTQINSNDKYLQNASHIVNIATKLEDLGILDPKIFNFGGGFPVASSYKGELLSNTFKSIKDIIVDNGYNNVMSYFEPGRYIVGDAGIGIVKIISTNKMKNFFYINSGGNIFPRFAKNPIRFYDIDKPIRNYNQPVNIYGIVLSDADILAKNYNFTKNYCTNDRVMMTNCGAYSITFSNRFPYYFPRLFLVDRDKYTEIHKISP